MSETSSVKYEIVELDAYAAYNLLDRNTNNRKVDTIAVETYRRQMSSGNWIFNGDPIRIDQNDVILDGQHRLLALSETDEKLPFLMVTGLDPKAFSTIDVGKKRSVGQALIHGGRVTDNANAIGAIGHGVLLLKGFPRPSVPEVEEFVRIHQAKVVQAFDISRAASRVLHSPKAVGVAAFELCKVDQWAAVEFFDSLATGADLQLGDPRLVLRSRMIKIAEERRSTSSAIELRKVTNLIYAAWNAWREGRAMSRLRLTDGTLDSQVTPR